MANRYRTAAGNWSNAAQWDGGTLPGVGDTCYANNFVTVVDANVTVVAVSNAPSAPAVAGGTFRLADGVTLTANTIGTGNSTVVNPVVDYNGVTPNQATLIGNTIGGTAAGVHGIANLNTGRLNVTGNVVGGNVSGAYGLYNASTGAVYLTGNYSGGIVSGGHGLWNHAGGAVNVAGNGAGSTTVGQVSSNAAVNNGAGSITITSGTLAANLGGALLNQGTGTITYTGNVAGSSTAGAACITNTSSGTITVNGNVTGGSFGSALGINSTANGTVNVTGNVQGAAGTGISMATGTLNITGSVYGSDTNNGFYGVTVGGACATTINGDVYGSNTVSCTASWGFYDPAAGGSFTLTGNVYGRYATAYNAAGSGKITSITGSIYGGTGVKSGTGAIITGPAGTATINAPAIQSDAGVALNISCGGTINGPVTNTGNVGCTFAPGAGATLTYTGNITASPTGTGVGLAANPAAGAVLNVIGNAVASVSGSASGITMAGGGTVNMTGNVYGGGAGTSFGAWPNMSGTFNLTGNAYAGASAANGAGIYASGGTINVYGTVFGTTSNSGMPGLTMQGANPVYVQCARGNNYPNDGITLPGLGIVNGNTYGITLDAMEFGSGGVSPVSGRIFVRDAGTNYVKMYQSNNGAVTVMGEVANDYPVPANVKLGVVYDFGAKVGACAVPPAASVAYGVPVAATTGTAALTPAALMGQPLIDRLSQCATVETTGDQLAAMLGV